MEAGASSFPLNTPEYTDSPNHAYAFQFYGVNKVGKTSVVVQILSPASEGIPNPADTSLRGT